MSNRRLRCEVLEDRLTPSSAGDLDPTFNGTGINSTAFGPDVTLDAVAIAPDGKIVVAGHSETDTVVNGRLSGTNNGVFVARLLSNGQFDTSFHGTGRLNIDDPAPGLMAGTTVQQDGGVNDLIVQQDGSILAAVAAAGIIVSNGGPQVKLDQISADGNTIKMGTFSNLGMGGVAVNRTTGDIYLAGTIGGGTHIGPAHVEVSRFDKELNPLGSVTVTAPSGQLDDNSANGIALDPTGRVYVVTYEPYAKVGLIRLNADLSQPLVKTNVYDRGQLGANVGIAINSAGQVFVMQSIFDLRTITTTTDDTPQGMVVQRFDSDLNEQARTTLNSIGGHRYIQSLITTDSAGRVVLVDNALPYQSANTDFAVARLNPTDLSLDTSFNKTGVKTLDVGKGDAPSDVAVDPAGNIVVVGQTATANATSGTTVIFRLLGSNNLPTGPVLVGGSTDGSAKLLTATNGSYQVGASTSFFPGSTGNVRTAVADVNGDGVPDYIGGSGPGGGPRVAIIDGKSGAKIADFFAFESSFTGGVYVSAADINGDGKADVIVTPDQGGGPVVAIYDGAKLTAGQSADAAQFTRFLGIDDANFRGGDRPALADVNGDGTPDLLVSAGFLGGPRIALYDGQTITNSTPVKLVPDFFAFEDSLRNGAFVTAGDLNSDGKADLAFGGGPGGAPRVRMFDGAKLLAAGSFSNLDAIASSAQVANFFAGDTTSRGGVRLTMRDTDGDGKADLITGSGEGEPSQVLVYKGATLLANATPSADQTLDPFSGATLAGGVFVG